MSASTDTGPEVPEFIPVIVAAPPRPWYKHLWVWITAAISAVLAAGLALGLLLTVFASSPSMSPSAVLARDGYTAIIGNMSATQVAALAGLGGSSSSDQQAVTAMVTAGAFGTRGSNMEIVLALTPAGKTLISAVLASGSSGLPQGVSAHMDGSDVIVSGPSSAFSSGS